MTTILEILNIVFGGEETWTQFDSLTSAFTGDEAVTNKGREYCEEMGCDADFYEIGNGTRFWVDGPAWTVV